MLLTTLRHTLFPYTTLFRSRQEAGVPEIQSEGRLVLLEDVAEPVGQEEHTAVLDDLDVQVIKHGRSEEHTSELQSPYDLVFRLLHEKNDRRVDLENINSRSS